MATKFYFFTDPTLLAPQTALQAFGPAGVSGGKDQFRVTDVHTSSSAAPAFAICDGLVCAQKDGQGTLTLILKPSQQPPFDFPAISYILYKGVDPDSLLATNGTIDTTQEADNKLIAAIKVAWELPDNNNGTTVPSRACLGLHLNPADYPAADNPARFADTEPLDRLFYDGDPLIQLPLVRGGWTLGKFAAGSSFGIEIVVERIGYRPKIGLSRKRENIIEVTSLDSSITYQSNDATYFTHWHAKEECLNFVDPCALWGSFFSAKLRVLNSGGSTFDRKTGNEIYDVVLRGGHDDATAASGNFLNRNKAYIDIRNEHGNSINYYKADGPNIQLTLDATADIDTCEINYYASGWPSFAVDSTNLPVGITGDKIDARFALPKTTNAWPLIYVSAGYRDHFRRLKESQRFIERARRGDSTYLDEAAITLPLAQSAGTTKIAGSYHKLCHFKRPLVIDGQAAPPPDPNALAPVYLGQLDHLLPSLDIDIFPSAKGMTFVKTSADEVLVNWPPAGYSAFVARPGFAKDNKNVYLFLVPTALYAQTASFSRRPQLPTFPAFVGLAEPSFLADYLAPLMPLPMIRREFDPQTTSITPASVTKVDLIQTGSPSRAAPFSDGIYDAFVVLAFGASEYQSGLSPASLSALNPLGTIFITLPAPQSRVALDDEKPYYETAPIASFLKITAQTVSRATRPSTIAVYANAST